MVENEMRGFLARRTRHPGGRGTGDDENDLIVSVKDPSAAADELVVQLDEQRVVLQQAMQEVKRRVKPETWTVFERTALLGDDAAVVAEEMGMSIVAVYKAKSRILEQLREYAQTQFNNA